MKSDLNALPYWSFLHIFEGVKFLLALNRTGKIRFSGTRKSVLLKATSGRYAPCNFVLPVRLEGTHVCLIVYLARHQMKKIMER